MTNLEKYLYQLRRIEEHREKKAEKEIRKIYKDILKELNSYLGNIYATYSEDDMLNYSDLAKAGMDARFLEEVEQRINGISPKVAKEINETVTQTYEACYDGMRNAVVKAAGNRELLQAAFATVSAATPDAIRAAVNNPVSGLTLKDTLEKHRKDIIYDIKKNIGVGLSNGDRFSTMANRIADSLDGDYTKAVRIVRTEAHRVRETGFHDAATDINNTLTNNNTGFVMSKTWRTMNDERVRPAKAKGKNRKYNHVKMDGVTIPVNEEFELPSGARGMAPSQTGEAGEDINCRCYLSYDLVDERELTKTSDKETSDKKQATPEEPQQKEGKVNIDNLPEKFTATKAERANTQKWVDYINNVEGADPRVLTMFDNMGKLGDESTLGAKISHGKNHAVKYKRNVYTGQIVDLKVVIPKISGDDIAGQVGTTMHELTHYIDLCKRNNKGTWLSASNPKLLKAFADASDEMADDIKKLFADFKVKHDIVRKEVAERQKAAISKLTDEYEGLNPYKDYARYKEYSKKRKKIIDEYEAERDYLSRNLLGGGVGNLQDIYDALSGGTFRDSGVVTYGHGSKYYRSKSARVEETLANYCALSVTRPDLIKMLKKDKPELCEALDELIDDIIKGVK